MAKTDQETPRKDESMPESDHAETIKRQVLEKTGTPPRLHHIEVCRHHNNNYRVNLWEKQDSPSDSAFSTHVNIGASFYLKVSDSGEILSSNPPLTKLSVSA